MSLKELGNTMLRSVVKRNDASASPVVDAYNTLLADYHNLEFRNLKLEREVRALRAALLGDQRVLMEGKGSGDNGEDNSQPPAKLPVNPSDMTGDDILRLQGELTDALRQKVFYAEQLLKLKNKMGVHVRRVSQKQEELIRKEGQIRMLEEWKANAEKEQVKSNNLIEYLRDMDQRSKKELTAALQRIAVLEAEKESSSKENMQQVHLLSDLVETLQKSAAKLESNRSMQSRDFKNTEELKEYVNFYSEVEVHIPTKRVAALRTERNNGACHVVQLSHKGTRYCTAGEKGEVRLWDSFSNKKLAVLTGPQSSVMDLAFDPSDSLIMAASTDKNCRIWDVQSRRLVHTLIHTGSMGLARVQACSFGPKQSEQCYSGGHNMTIKAWNIRKGSCVKEVETGSAVNAMSVSSDLLASGHMDDHFRVWSHATWEQVAKVKAHSQALTDVQFSKDGAFLLTMSTDDTLKLYDRRNWEKPLWTFTGTQRNSFETSCSFAKATLSPDGSYAAAGSKSGDVFVWDCSNGKLVDMLLADAAVSKQSGKQEPETVESKADSPERRGRSGGFFSKMIRKRSSSNASAPTTRPTIKKLFPSEKHALVTSLDWNQNGKQVVVSHICGIVSIWEWKE